MTVCEKFKPFSLAAHLCFRHPDKNKDPGAEDKFIQISKAYEVLCQTLSYLISAYKVCLRARRQWLMAIILATQEAEIRWIEIESQPGEIVL
jgi:hypothetical protein